MSNVSMVDGHIDDSNPRMTDNEIIKALEVIRGQSLPYIVSPKTLRETIDLINRQQAEIESTKKSADEWHRVAELNANEIIKLQAENEGLQLENEKLEIELKGKVESLNKSTNSAMEVIKKQDAEIERLQYCNEANISSIGTLHERIKEKDAEIEKWTKELKITREYMHNNGLEWDLLSYYTRKEEQNV